MIIRKLPQFRYSDVTPKDIYLNRRRFLATALAAPAAVAFGGAKIPNIQKSPLSGDEKPSAYNIVTQFNNFYEFGTDKEDPYHNAQNFKTVPWAIRVTGECAKPTTFDLDAIMKLAPLEQRIFRMRCVEGWSYVVPWVGYSLSALIKQVEPTANAKYVAFRSYHDTKQMPLATYFRAHIQFPYLEGLRMDEALHPLATLVVGAYDEILPNQNGAPVRLVVPWKYGFKSIKSIAEIRFTEKQPPTTWNVAWPEAYGFYSNVNPNRDHPGHSQRMERRLGAELLRQRRETLMFNGYGDVATLYNGMDLRKNY
jgi:sulfoxide reductase catalytic subunit YedY